MDCRKFLALGAIALAFGTPVLPENPVRHVQHPKFASVVVFLFPQWIFIRTKLQYVLCMLHDSTGLLEAVLEVGHD